MLGPVGDTSVSPGWVCGCETIPQGMFWGCHDAPPPPPRQGVPISLSPASLLPRQIWGLGWVNSADEK